jgi:hypothetical protein
VHDSIRIHCIQNRPQTNVEGDTVSITYKCFVCIEDTNLNKLPVIGKGEIAGIIDGSNARSVEKISSACA